MSELFVLRPTVVAVILAMAVATYATKTSGFWLVSRLDLSDRLRVGLRVLPGAVVVAFVAPALVAGGIAEWIAAALTVGVAHKTGNLLAALLVGILAVVFVRTFV